MNDTLNATAAEATLFETTFYLSCGILGVAFNALVLFIAFKFVDTHDKPRQLIVINMTAADFLMSFVFVLTRPYVEYLPLFMCYPYYILICSSQLCSCINLLWLNIDKFIFVQFPLHYYSIVTRTRLMVLTLLTWVITCGYAAVGYYFLDLGDLPHRCDKIDVPKAFVISLPVAYILALVGSFITSFIVFVIARRTCEIENKSHSKVLRQFFFLFSSTLWTFLTSLPYRLLYMYAVMKRYFIYTQEDDPTLFRAIGDFMFRALVLGIVVNPWITILTQRIYRIRLFHYVELLSCISKKKNSIDYSAVSSKDGRSRRTSGRNTSLAECRTLADNTADF